MEVLSESDELAHDLEELGLTLRILEVEALSFRNFLLVHLPQRFILLYCLLQLNFVLLDNSAVHLPLGLRSRHCLTLLILSQVSVHSAHAIEHFHLFHAMMRNLG